MKKILPLVLVLVLIVSILVLGCAPKAATAPTTKQFTWTFQCPYPKGDTSYDIVTVNWVKDIERLTNGRLTFKVFTGDEVVPGAEVHNNIPKGTLDAGLLSGTYAGGTIPSFYLVASMPGFWSNIDDAYTLIYEKGLLEIERKAFLERNMYLLLATGNGGIYTFTNFPIRTVDDFKGKKIRAPGVRQPLFQELGSTVVSLPAGEIYMALKLGTLDGTSYTGPELETLKFKEVVKYVSLPALYNPTGVAFAINLDRWNELPDDLKAILNKYSKDQFKRVSQLSQDIEDDAFAKGKAYGVEFITLSETDQRKIRAAAEKSIMVPYSEKDKYFAEGAKIIKDFWAKK